MSYLICLILNLFIEKSENNRAKNQNEKTPPKNIIPYKQNKKSVPQKASYKAKA